MGKQNAAELHRAYDKKESIAIKWPRKRAFMKHTGNLSTLTSRSLIALKYVLCKIGSAKKIRCQ